MGIINVTPDSFSDGGRFVRPEIAVAHGLRLAALGASILDIGGESTRPNASRVSEREELRRVLPVIEGLASRIKIPLSVDTMKPAVARVALTAGASIVNDVRAGECNSEMWDIVSEFRAGYICMHAPSSLHQKRAKKDIILEVENFFAGLMKKLRRAGIPPEQIILDPGIGFGKTSEQNLRLLRELQRFTKWKRPLLLGVSRKSFIKKIVGGNVNERLPASLACAILGIKSGAQIIRAHDVAETVQAIRMAEAVLGMTRK